MCSRRTAGEYQGRTVVEQVTGGRVANPKFVNAAVVARPEAGAGSWRCWQWIPHSDAGHGRVELDRWPPVQRLIAPVEEDLDRAPVRIGVDVGERDGHETAVGRVVGDREPVDHHFVADGCSPVEQLRV